MRIRHEHLRGVVHGGEVPRSNPMIKNIIRVIVGLVLLTAAYRLHCKAIDTTDKAIGATLKVGDELPSDRADLFFGEDPRVVAQRPENQAMLASARHLERLAGVSILASAILILLGVLPIVVPPTFRVLVWLFIPDFLRRRRNDPAIEMASEAATEAARSPGPETVPLG
jgi:hypothetical protein